MNMALCRQESRQAAYSGVLFQHHHFFYPCGIQIVLELETENSEWWSAIFVDLSIKIIGSD